MCGETSGSWKSKRYGLFFNWHQDCLQIVLVGLSLAGLFFFLFLLVLLHILDGQLVKVLFAAQAFENLHPTLEKTAKSNPNWT